MRFAISIPQVVPDSTFDPIELRDYLRKAESLGFASAWIQEGVLSSAPILSPLELMTFASDALGCEPTPATLAKPGDLH